MKRKIRVGILFGGRSAEHEVSLQSAKNIVQAIDKEKYEVVLIGIDRGGRWVYIDSTDFFWSPGDARSITIPAKEESLMVTPCKGEGFIRRADGGVIGIIDVVFPVLHGTFGEDGTLQGLLKLAEMPFVGSDVLGTAVGMDKDVMKRLLRDAGIPTPDFLVYTRKENRDIHFSRVKGKLGLPLFIKPVNLGSSVGINKVNGEDDFNDAVQEAFLYDSKIIIEECIEGREIECSVLGNENPIASVPGEIKPRHEFYSYDAKYVDEKGAEFEIPAQIPKNQKEKIQSLAVKTFKVLCCEGMARVDLFLRADGEVLVNEINTIPGFTQISMYPKLWEASGISQTELIDRLIKLALDRYKKESTLKRSLF
jgi:D-alanine-D-alanine ligase